MTNEYKIAVLLPTRGRTEALDRSLLGLLEKATDPGSIQVLLGLDNDDKIGITHFQDELQSKLDNLEVDYTAMAFEPLGYGRLNEYINELAKNSSADWLFFWNDDAIMQTQGWDDKIVEHTGEFKLLAVHTHNDHPYSIFPILPREWLDVVGHLSLHSMTDAWLSQIAFMIDIWERIDIDVIHDRADLTGNNKDTTYKNRELLEGNPRNPRDFHNPTQSKLRIKDCEILWEHLKSQGSTSDWWDRVKANQQDPWEKLKANDPHGQMRQYDIRVER